MWSICLHWQDRRHVNRELRNAWYVTTHPESLFYLRFTEIRRPGEGKENHLLAGEGADVMVHGHDLDASDLPDHRFHDWAGRFD